MYGFLCEVEVAPVPAAREWPHDGTFIAAPVLASAIFDKEHGRRPEARLRKSGLWDVCR
ncbi:MAG TPA: hypothetical protein VNQ99_17330 [Xanthobacteraceae bacterium]|nr:hypothetical protein [Xanthobacteraceae bacterium]